MLRPLIEYSNDYESFRVGGNIVANCNSILFWNIGDTDVSIMGGVLHPGQWLELTGNVGEVDKTQYFFSFVPPVNANPELNVIRKTYANNA